VLLNKEADRAFICMYLLVTCRETIYLGCQIMSREVEQGHVFQPSLEIVRLP